MNPDQPDRRHRHMPSLYHLTVAYTTVIVTAVLLMLVFGGHS